MFTGLVADLGSVATMEATADGVRLRVASTLAGELSESDSVAVDGVCLTVVENGGGRLAFDVVPETLERIKPFGAHVNLEPALRAGEPLGGHYVQGHVDGVGSVVSLEPEGAGARLRLATPELGRYCVEKGSLTVEGVSLTVAAVDEDAVEIALVPHTLAATTLGRLAPGDSVNVEVDVLAKYVEKLLRGTITR